MEEEEEDPLVLFLQDRGIEEQFINKIKHDKIDCLVIPIMSEKDLSKYIPSYGDRLAAVAFCRNHQPSASASRKSQLIDRIKARLCASEEKALKRADTLNKLKGNANGKRKTRRVEIGWMHFNENNKEFKQVRTVNGGGTRHVTVDKSTTVHSIQEMAESLFFPNGVSQSLKLQDHICDIRDFSQNELDADCTVADLYDKTKVRILRFYLCTKKRVQDTEHTASSPQETTSSVTATITAPDVPESQSSEDNVITIDLTLLHDADVSHMLTDAGITSAESLSGNILSDQEQQEQGMFPEGIRLEQQSEEIIRQEDTAEMDEIQNVEIELNTYSNDEVIIGASLNDAVDLDDTLLWENKPEVIIVVSRGNCMNELIAAFMDPDIMSKDVHIKRKLPNGKLEEGEGSGVLRDCLSEFWGEFYTKCTLGTDVKTPYLRHEYQVQEWQAIARILVTGWLTVQYFPILLPLPFLEEALYGITYSSVPDCFMQYVSKEERKILQLAVESFESVDNDDLIDVLDAHDCHQIPRKETISPLLMQLGHKALIQTPMFVIKCWRPILKCLADTLHPQRLVEMMEERIPTSKRVKALLKFPEEMSPLQNTVARHLRKYIGETDDLNLKSFLRFCTGADILLGHPITVQFTETSSFQCRPQAHTCGSYLVIPTNYQNYPDLRNDFDLILNSSIWVMDIV